MILKNRGRKVKIRKWSFFIMLTIISSIILVACSGENEEVSVDKGNEQNNELEENEGEPEETYDLGGRTIKIDFHAGMERSEERRVGKECRGGEGANGERRGQRRERREDR